MKRRSIFTYMGLCLSTLLLLVSCGKSDVQLSKSSIPTDGVKLGFSAWPGWLPWQVASEASLLDTQAGKFTVQWFDNYLDSLKAFHEDKIQANSQTLNDTIAAIAHGEDQVVVLVNDNSTGNDKIIVRPGISNVADLKGKTIALEIGTVDHFLFTMGLQRAGLTPNDVTIVPMEASKSAAAFVAGQVDAVALFAPFTTEAFKRPGSKELFSSKTYPGMVVDHLVVHRSLIKDHPEQVQALVNTWFDTLNYSQRNAAKSMQIQAKRAGVSVPEYEAYAQGTQIFTLAQNIDALYPARGSDTSVPGTASIIAKFLYDAHLTKTLPNIDGMFDDRFVKAYAAAHSSKG
jgi:NitT/TauT family transport system substrate-binding protein